jgi:hypothetical protein
VARALIIVVLFGCLVARANTYYVRLDGNDSQAGTATNTAWRTIGHAASIAVAGDSVSVGPGEFNEFVTPPRSGSLGKPITFTGTRGNDGSWLTTINPSSLYTNWVAAPEIGSGVYKLTGLANPIAEMTVGTGDQRIISVWTLGSLSFGTVYSSTTPNFTTGAGMLSMPANATAVDYYSGATINFWGNIGALYCNDGTTCYLRFADGRNPNTQNVRGTMAAGTYASGSPDMNGNALFLYNVSYNTWKNFRIHGGFTSIFLYGAGCYGNLVQSNYVDGGQCPILLQNSPYNNVVQGNEVFGNYYGWTNHGAWASVGSPGATTAVNGYRANIYTVQKLLMSAYNAQSSTDWGICILDSGSSNVVCGNYVHHSFGTGITIDNDNAPAATIVGTLVYSNVIANHAESGILLGRGQVGTLVHHNQFFDNHDNVRVQRMDWPNESTRSMYVYRNTFWQPSGPGVAEHIYAHWANPTGPVTTNILLWVYQNSFAGGRVWFFPNGYAINRGGCPGFMFCDNIISDVSSFSEIDGPGSGWGNVGMVGACDYNKSSARISGLNWCGSHNIQSSTNEWVNDVSPAMSFRLSSGSIAVDAGLDLAQPFTLAGSNYAALPFGTDVKVGSAWDLGAYELGLPSVLQPPASLRLVSSTP